MARLLITRIYSSPIEFLDVSPEWALDAHDKLTDLMGSQKETIELIYRTPNGSKYALIKRTDLKSFEAAF